MNRRLRGATAAVVIAAAVLSGCAGEGTTSSGGLDNVPAEVHVTGATITPAGRGRALVTFGAHNAGTQTDRLLGVTCDCGGAARLLDPTGQPTEAVDIAPEETLFLGPGSVVVEIRALPRRLKPGSFVGLRITFAIAGEARTDAEVATAA